MKSTLKLIIAVIAVLSYFILTLILSPLLYICPFKIRKVLNYIVSFYCGFLRLLLRIKIDNQLKKELNQGNYLIASNHLSYLDIIVISSILPTCFITSMEMKKSIGLGHVCRLAGCLFVERRSRDNISKEIQEIVTGLKKNLNVLLFAEATSTNGEKVIPFKRSLFQAAVDAKQPTRLICLNYTEFDGEALTLKNRDRVCWYGDMDFFPHFQEVLKQKSLKVTVKDLEVITASEVNYDSGILRDKAHEIISKNYKNIC